MLEGNRNQDLLFVNGVNTAIGGSVAESNKIWEASFRSNGVDYGVLNTVPRFRDKKKSRWYLLLLSIYFLPGTLFRLIGLPIFEFAYKISPILIIRFVIAFLIKRPKRVIFSHHSVFYLALFCLRAKRVFLIHDLMYVRGRSRGASRRAQRFYFFVELYFYRLSPTLLVQSYHEWRVLRHFLDKRIYLISCCGLKLDSAPIERQQNIAVISDWRRPENVHGAITFFSSSEAKKYSGKRMGFRFFGFNSASLVDKLNSTGLPSSIDVMDGGVYERLSDISDGYFLVPIYHGAGVKRKTFEALCAGRMVIGTKGAFVGLPPWMISKVVMRVTSLHDLSSLPNLPAQHEFSKSLISLSQSFSSIGEIEDLWR